MWPTAKEDVKKPQTSKSISRKGAKSQRAQREQSNCFLRVFAPWRFCVRLFKSSHLLTPWALPTWRFWGGEPPARRYSALPALGLRGLPADPGCCSRLRQPPFGAGIRPEGGDPSCLWAFQAAEKLVDTVILRSRRRRRISHCLENARSEILRFARDDSFEEFFRSLFRQATNFEGKRGRASLEFPSRKA
jgi:hypothetical protein